MSVQRWRPQPLNAHEVPNVRHRRRIRMIATPIDPGGRMSDQLADAAGIVVKTTALSVDVAVTRLEAMIAEKGMKLFALIDHSGEAAAAGLELRDTKVVIFGSPTGGTPVMDAVPLVALDL